MSVSGRSLPSLSRLYLLAGLACLFWLWWRPTQPLQYRAQLTIFVLTGAPFVMLVDNLLLTGPRSFLSSPLMLRAFLRSRRSTFVMFDVSALGLLWLDPNNDVPMRGVMLAASIVGVLLFIIQPASVLLLGASRRTIAEVGNATFSIFPLRTVTLLSTQAGLFMGGISPLTDVLRTDSDADWRTMVEMLVDAVPCVVIDVRHSSPAVLEEVERTLGSSDRIARTIFVVGDDGSSPMFAQLAAQGRSDLAVVQVGELGSALRGRFWPF